VTAQVFRHASARVENSAPIGYTRAVGAPSTDPAPSGEGEGAAQATITDGRPVAPSAGRPVGPTAPVEPPVWMPVPTPEEEEFPLRARARNLRRRYHRQHAAAATPLDELAVLTDYVRSGQRSGERAGMRHPESEAAVRTAITALRAAGDTRTAAMHDWRPPS
jgi:hypothetical protein